MLDQRAVNIRESLERAEAAKVEAERLLEEYKQHDGRGAQGGRHDPAAGQAGCRVDPRRGARPRRRPSTTSMLAKAREAIEGEKRAAIAELQTSVADLSVAVAGKLIGAELTRG